MILSDYHVHTMFSDDSTAAPEEQVDTLIKKGIKYICITDHEDIGYPDNGFLIDADAYYKKLLELKSTYTDINISAGVELGLRPDYRQSIIDFSRIKDWDFIIGSTHVVNGIDPYFPEYWSSKSRYCGIWDFYKITLENIKAFDCFDVYGHIDYIIRYAPKCEKGEMHDFTDITDEILKTLIYKGKGIECNTAGFKYGLDHPNPDECILKRYRELGGEILTIGSDGHKPEHTAYGFDRLPSLLKECGFRYYTIFNGRKPQMLPL